jgi:hypothetical protein
MHGFVGSRLPETGALGLSIMGGIGMFSSSMFQPVIGGWIKDNKTVVEAQGLMGEAADLAAGQMTLSNMLLFPAILIVAFAGLYFFSKKKAAKIKRFINFQEGAFVPSFFVLLNPFFNEQLQ